MKAILFDLDGVLVDSVPLIAEAWKRACTQFNIKPAPWKKVNGTNPASFINALLPGKEAAFLAAFQKHIAENRDSLMLFPGAKATIRRLMRQYKVGITTSAPESYLLFIKKKFGLPYDACLSLHPPLKDKPAPDIHLAMAKMLGVLPEDCLVVEDGLVGILAAKSAGMKAVAISNPYLADASKADKVIKKLSDLTIPFIEKLG
ncbi:MAG: HAD family phosphatase [Nanoarchaeota archaeon]